MVELMLCVDASIVRHQDQGVGRDSQALRTLHTILLTIHEVTCRRPATFSRAATQVKNIMLSDGSSTILSEDSAKWWKPPY